MNCKQGDLAIVVKGALGHKSPNLGKIVTCLKLYPAGTNGYNLSQGPLWEVDKQFEDTWGGSDCFMFDSFLRPLRGELSGDEIEQPLAGVLTA